LLDLSSRDAIPSRLSAKGVIEPSGERYQLTLSIEVGQIQGSRVISSVDCPSLGKAAAVVLGLLIRKERDLGRDLSDSDLGNDFQRQSKPPEPEASEPSASVSPPAEDKPDAEPGWLLVRGPTLMFDASTLPEYGWGISGGVGVHLAPLRLFATGGWWAAQTKTVGDGGNEYRATFKRRSIEAWGCRGWNRGALSGSPCVSLGVDVFDASASGSEFQARSQRATALSAAAGFSGYWHWGPTMALVLSTTGRIWLQRPKFVVQGMLESEVAHFVPVAAFQAAVGTEWIF
jgi:hypothetical protein